MVSGGDSQAKFLSRTTGADPTIPTTDGTTPLMVAAGLYSHRGSFRRFEARGWTDDILAAVALCLDLGNDVNAINEVGDTALHGAAYRGALDVAQLLIDNGAKLDATDTRGLTPLAVASGVYYIDGLWRTPETADLLRERLQTRGLATDVPTANSKELCLYCDLTNYEQYKAAQQHARELEELFKQERVTAQGAS